MPTAMPAEEEEEDGQTLWQSVLLFCCKGMIEGIIVILFFWLLIQVLFTKELESKTHTSRHTCSSVCAAFVCLCM